MSDIDISPRDPRPAGRKKSWNYQEQYILRCRILCPMPDRKIALDWTIEERLRVISTGPRRVSLNRFDTDRFELIAEFEYEPGPPIRIDPPIRACDPPGK